MALIKCPECAKEVSDTAKICLNCGKKLKKSPVGKIFRIMGIIVAFIIVIILIMALISLRITTQRHNTIVDHLSSALGNKLILTDILAEQAKELGNQFALNNDDILKADIILADYVPKNAPDSLRFKLIATVVDMAVVKKMPVTEAAEEVGQMIKQP